LDRVGALKPRNVTFDNTVRALDDISHQVSLTADRFSLLKETSTSAACATRDRGREELQEWAVGLITRGRL